jgi:DNA-binding MarR family transcriptional regulator
MDNVDILVNIRKIVRSINLESKRVQKDFGISIPQLLCLGHLSRAPKNISSHKDLMKLLSLNSSTITGIINRLELRGFVKRISSETDKRVTQIILTKKGSDVVAQSPDVLHDQLAKKLKSLPESTQIKIKDALTIIVNAMDIDAIDASPIITINDPIEGSQSVSLNQ